MQDTGKISLPERIEALIAQRALRAGDRLPSERAMAADFGVSRNSLREAIQQLISHGRLISRRGGGTYVAQPAGDQPVPAALLPLTALARGEADYWQDIMEIRQSLEGDTAHFAALRATARDKAHLGAAYHAMAAIGPDASLAMARADAAFHMAVAQAAQNPVLHQVMAGLMGLLELNISDSLSRIFHLPGILEQLDQQHRAILDAITAGQPEAARAVAHHHLTFVESQLRIVENKATRERRSSRTLRHLAQEKELAS